MTSDSLEELRQRLLRDESVREMIRARAYEIFLMRGVQAGSAAQDWFQAESEVLAFLLANHYTTEKEMELVAATPDASSVVQPTTEPVAPKKRKPRSTIKETSAKKPATKRTAAKKSGQSESKPKRSRKESKSEDKPS